MLKRLPNKRTGIHPPVRVKPARHMSLAELAEAEAQAEEKRREREAAAKRDLAAAVAEAQRIAALRPLPMPERPLAMASPAEAVKARQRGGQPPGAQPRKPQRPQPPRETTARTAGRWNPRAARKEQADDLPFEY